MPSSTMPFYHQPGQYLNQPPLQAMVASSSSPRYQPYVESEGTSEVGDEHEEAYEVDHGLDSPPPPGPSRQSRHNRQQPTSEHHQTDPGSPEQAYTTTTPIAPTSPEMGDAYLHYSTDPGTSQAAQSQPRAVSSEDPSYDEPADYEGQGYGSEAAEWQGIAAHQHHATRLSDVLEAEEESARSPQSTRSSRVLGQ